MRLSIFSSSARASAVTCRRQTDRQTCTLQYSAAVVKGNLPYHSNFGPLMSTCYRHCLSRAFFLGGSGFPQGGVSPNLQFPPNDCQLVCSKYCYFRGGGEINYKYITGSVLQRLPVARPTAFISPQMANKSVFSFLRTLTTSHCPHPLTARATIRYDTRC